MRVPTVARVAVPSRIPAWVPVGDPSRFFSNPAVRETDQRRSLAGAGPAEPLPGGAQKDRGGRDGGSLGQRGAARRRGPAAAALGSLRARSLARLLQLPATPAGGRARAAGEALATYLGRQWNAAHNGDDRLERVRLFRVSTPIDLAGDPEPSGRMTRVRELLAVAVGSSQRC